MFELETFSIRHVVSISYKLFKESFVYIEFFFFPIKSWQPIVTTVFWEIPHYRNPHFHFLHILRLPCHYRPTIAGHNTYFKSIKHAISPINHNRKRPVSHFLPSPKVILIPCTVLGVIALNSQRAHCENQQENRQKTGETEWSKIEL